MTWCFRNKLLLGKLKDTKNGVKSIFLKNMIFPKNLNLGRKSVFGENNPFLEYFLGNNCKKKTGGAAMRRRMNNIRACVEEIIDKTILYR